MANKKKKSKKEEHSVDSLEVTLGLTAAAVAAAGAYFLYGSKEADLNRKKVKSWALKAKAEVLEKLEDAKAITEHEYHDLVDTVAGAYTGVRKATKGDISAFKDEMKDHWDALHSAAKTKNKPRKKTAKKATKKKAAKKTTKKKSAKKATKKSAKKTAKKATKKKA